MKETSKNIIFFLPNFSKGGSGYAILKLCGHLKNKGFKLHVICIGKCALKKELNLNKVKVYEIQSRSTFFSMSSLRMIAEKISISNNLRTVFVSNHHYANVTAIIALRKNLDIKKVLIERTSLAQLRRHYSIKDFFKKQIILFLIKILYSKSDLIIANSRREASDIKKFCNTKTTHIYPAAYKKIKIKIQRKRKKDINILNIGSLIKEKGIDTIIKAIHNLNNKNIKLNVLGEGYDKNQDEKKYLIDLIKSYKLQNQIKLHGFKNNLQKFYINSDLYINSSHCEGFSSSIVEAMNYNIPVICSDCKGGNREITDNGKAGALFEVDKYYELKNQIKFYLNNKKSVMKKIKYANNHIKKFSYINNFLSYEKIFKKI
jgi:glycosyltransferase involved in cell wall biosynthesis